MLKKILALVTLSTNFAFDYDALYASMKNRPEFSKLKKILTHQVNKEYLDENGKLRPHFQLSKSKNFETEYQSLLYFGYLAADLVLTPSKIKKNLKTHSGKKKLINVAKQNRLPSQFYNYIQNGSNFEQLSKVFLQRKLYSFLNDTAISTLDSNEKKPLKEHIKSRLFKDISSRNTMYSKFEVYANVYSKRRNNIIDALTCFALTHQLRNKNISKNPQLENIIDNAIYPTTLNIAKIISGNGVPKLSYGKLVETILNFEIAENGPYNMYQEAGKYGDPAGISYHKIADLKLFGTDLTKNPVYQIATKHDRKFEEKVNSFHKGGKAPTITHARINNQRTGLFYSRALALYNNITFGDIEGTIEMIKLIESNPRMRKFAYETDLFLEMNKVSINYFSKSLNQLKVINNSFENAKTKEEKTKAKKLKEYFMKTAQSKSPDIRSNEASTFLLTKIVTDYIVGTDGTEHNFGQVYRRFNGGNNGAKEIFEFEDYLKNALTYAQSNKINTNKLTEQIMNKIQNIRHPKKIDYYYRNLLLNSYMAKRVFYPQLENNAEK